MGSDHFVKVFDVVDAGYRTWTFPAFGLIFVAVGLIIFFFPKIINALGIPNLNFRSGFQAFFRYGFLGFALLWTGVAFFGTYSDHLHQTALVQQNRCRIVEGPVDQFVPMPAAGHAQESFSVSGVPFRYSDFNMTGGFNNTSSHGGPLRSDSYVRICYDPQRNVILRLEIRDFKGELKDYAKSPPLFPFPSESEIRELRNKHPMVAVPWYSNLFIVPFILDWLGIYTLFVPYLRTFFSVKTATVSCSVPPALNPGRKIKLRNSMIYWDPGTRGIWLRPRGLNSMKVAAMVAKLSIDPNTKSITGTEIRFSSGILVAMALFLWTAYLVFSRVMQSSPNGFSPALFVGFFAVVILIIGFFNLRILRSRMEQVIDDALFAIERM